MHESAASPQIWQLEREIFQLRTLLEVARALGECRESRAIYSEVLAILAGTFGARQAVAVSQNQDGRWQCMASRGELTAAAVTGALQQAGVFTLEKILAELRRLIDPGRGLEHFAVANFATWRNQRGGAFLLGPRLLGEPYAEADRELLEAVAGFTARALENLQLYEALQEAQEKLRLENLALREAVRRDFSDSALLGQSAAMQQVRQQIRNFGRSEANVLITGETGTGKELVARALHHHSLRADGPFLGVNCTAIPENLVETEFFGIEAGTATGVRKHVGLFEQAHGGTLFIDEVGDMPAASQAKLLRVLQQRSLRRIGGDREIPVNVRVIAATNKNLGEAIAAGTFREDLFYRLAVLELRLPPLRDHREDVVLLAQHFLGVFEQKLRRKTGGLSPALLQHLENYHWPGNVRELENEMERLVTLAEEGQLLLPEHLSPKLRGAGRPPLPAQPATLRLRDAVDQLEREMITAALARHHGNKSQVARVLGLSRLGLQQKMLRLGVADPQRDKQ
ncbi:MAG: sigma-54-dependent Fis family transcriptional regulator [candidate division KSB1 bacterium]|nr:sigma-54-dependent Fis family transcriptional regulator [candidate division KSB1 bacterium]MDZ7409332.1 sigma-54-dependent Fis family transcriptional regulator [candidate division KSB1 bacterium]